MQKLQEVVLYYQAVKETGAADKTDAENKTNAENKAKTADKEKEKTVRMMKSVLVRMGVRIKNIGPEQVMEKVGYLAGIEGFTSLSQDEQQNKDKEKNGQENLPVLSRDVLVMKNFSSSRIDMLLAGLRKAGVPKIELKAVITPQNAEWTFYQLYQELEKEHESFQK